ncbi:flavin reductase [Oceanispirochaeta sp.]|jgi:flavin reductase (DIM6/NTAB) family NADH-FMN oxidoreductase RutF|uniref:flavin reductase family protein n=1 Tax=Oceanispirochaeta sp. TaxID=2035350 RepID=UPI0026348924|nr:flavin reductase [Oceanispirochaeta sp.]MDA3957524.1 flavin reductase [Oceanispirochaeta sp.]
MTREEIDANDLRVNSTTLWKEQWLLLTSGDYEQGHYNSMTVAWGSMGVMWKKPFVQVVVRPGRYTYEFIEKYPDFTLSVLPEGFRNTMSLMGSESGRFKDKIAESGLTPLASLSVKAPAFSEAELILECRTMYRDTIKPECFKDESLEINYPLKDYHTLYFAEILRACGTSDYWK